MIIFTQKEMNKLKLPKWMQKVMQQTYRDAVKKGEIIKRMIYKQNPTTGWWESAPILTGHGMSVASYKDLTYKIVSYDTGITIVEKTVKSSHMLKKNIKKELMSRGAIFDDEIRKLK
jgi:hypothetical protein